ncbi:MAG TPA: FGGY-family carbohydrate kinase [Opitutaceae bacterium]|jgi:rhamnulokinase
MTKSVACAAVDLGATSGRVIVGSWRASRLELTEVHRFPNGFKSLAGHEYWDVPTLWSEVRKGLLEAKRRFPRLASVGVDSWAVDFVLVDRNGRPVFPVHCYRDVRTAAGSAELDRQGLARIYQLTGLPNYPYNSSLQLQETIRSYPSLAQVVKRCLFIPDYFNFLLSDRMENELSVSSHSQLLDCHSMTWSAEALRRFGIPRAWFPAPSRSPRRLGPVRGWPELAGTLSLLVPGHDTACAFMGTPAAEDHSDLILSTGTWSLAGCQSKKPFLGPEALAQRISNERMGDGSFRPLQSCLGLWLLERVLPDFNRRPNNRREWSHLIASAAREPAPAVLLDVTDKSLFNPPKMRAAIDAALRRKGGRAPHSLSGYVRLICESLGQGHANAARGLEQFAGRKFSRIVVVGGGSRNPLLCQATARASGLPVAAYALEGAAVGNLAAQLIALGEVEDLADFRARLGRQLVAKKYSAG